MNIGLIGCGNISDTYFESQNIFNNLKIVACADIVQELADILIENNYDIIFIWEIKRYEKKTS